MKKLSPESVNYPDREEDPVLIKKFSPEAAWGLERDGYWIGELTGKSINFWRAAGKPFHSTWHQDHPGFEATTSRKSQVAINPRQLFLPESYGMALDEIERLVEKRNLQLQKRIEGVEMIVGEAPDYVELAFTYSDDDPETRLFGRKYGHGITRTRTVLEDYDAQIFVGDYNEKQGLFIGQCIMTYCSHPDMAVFPLIVPK